MLLLLYNQNIQNITFSFYIVSWYEVTDLYTFGFETWSFSKCFFIIFYEVSINLTVVK